MDSVDWVVKIILKRKYSMIVQPVPLRGAEGMGILLQDIVYPALDDRGGGDDRQRGGLPQL